MADNGTDWDQNLKIMSMAYNTTINLGTRETPFKLTFGRDANLSSMLDRTTHTIHEDLLNNCPRRHEYYLNKAKKLLN